MKHVFQRLSRPAPTILPVEWIATKYRTAESTIEVCTAVSLSVPSELVPANNTPHVYIHAIPIVAHAHNSSSSDSRRLGTTGHVPVSSLDPSRTRKKYVWQNLCTILGLMT